MKNNTPLVSIIICLYNVASFLQKKKLACILQQTYRNLEVILVDDGSTDNTYLLCEELKKSDQRIRLVRKANGGLGSARNAGLDEAQGDYVWFYDVDDDADTRLVEKNIYWMETYGSDVNIFGYHCITPYLHLSEEIRFKEREIHDNETLKSIFVDELLFVPNGNGFAWNKFYRRSFIEKYGFRFGNQRIQQDEGFNLQFYPLLNNVYISSELLYTYYIYNSGNNRSRYISNRINIYISVYNQLQSFITAWGVEDKRLEEYTYKRLYSGIVISLTYNLFHPNFKKTYKEKKTEFISILSKKQVVECLKHMQINKQLDLEQTLFVYSYLKKDFTLFFLLKNIFDSLRLIKKKISRLYAK
jgi:glycosyltransferase involved in cell wall biosynthesis